GSPKAIGFDIIFEDPSCARVLSSMPTITTSLLPGRSPRMLNLASTHRISRLVRKLRSFRSSRFIASHAKASVSTNARMAGILFFRDAGRMLLAIEFVERRQVTLKPYSGQGCYTKEFG